MTIGKLRLIHQKNEFEKSRYFFQVNRLFQYLGSSQDHGSSKVRVDLRTRERVNIFKLFLSTREFTMTRESAKTPEFDSRVDQTRESSPSREISTRDQQKLSGTLQ